ncbi:hypothetical protein TNCT_386031 [Trichonephila clavata]|uniref:F-box domain-containing protein n=1 Tax=Trichonephila clavata TaxID=2740835 RepID=A0A8X6HMJ7_TRICU|nr:hypothetical protein TNCT_386031 [Trichonephila clavata]
MAHINDLPYEILVKIFLEFLKTESQFYLFHKVAKTCLYWSKVCMDASLWHVYDGTLSFQTLQMFCEEGYLKNVETFSFSENKTAVTREDLKLIYSNLPNVRCINFSNVRNELQRTKCFFISELQNHCLKLNEIIINEQSTCHNCVLKTSLFNDFIDFRGPKLVSLDFSNLCVSNVKGLFLIIASSCRNLEHLKVQNLSPESTSKFFPIEIMQEGLKKLQVLCLGSPVILKSNKSLKTNGFPALEIFTHPSRCNLYIHDFCFKRLLMKSPNLKILDIRGCMLLTVEALCALPTSNLERLYVSYTKLYTSLNFMEVLRKWGHSLEVLDFSKLKGSIINDHFTSVISSGNLRNLESLYISNTSVTISTVRLIIENCPKLNFLQLESCRELDRGCKRAHQGKIALKKLLSKLADNMDTT